MITDCVFWESSQKIISSSKDSFIKIWDLQTQHCVQTIVGHRYLDIFIKIIYTKNFLEMKYGQLI